MVIVLMGVSGSGKTTVGRILAGELGWTFIEADEFHPAANIDKMRSGVPLNDADRRPWLDALRERIDRACQSGENVILACSALKRSYRATLKGNCRSVQFVYLEGGFELVNDRLSKRTGHYMNPALLQSQFDALEEPSAAEAVRVDISPLPEIISAAIERELRLG